MSILIKKGRGSPHFSGVRPFITLFIIFSFIFRAFPCYAYSLTTSSTPGDFDCPDTSQVWTIFKQEHKNVFLFYNSSTQYYYLVGVEDYTSLSGTACQFIYRDTPSDKQWLYSYLTNYWNDYRFGNSNANALKVYYWSDVMAEQDWYQDSNFNGSQDNRYGRWFDTSGLMLIAYDMYTPAYDTLNGETRECFYFGYYSNSNWFLTQQWCTSVLAFDEDGHLSNYEPTVDDNFNNWFGKLRQWLIDLGNSISNNIGSAINNIQGWLTTLGTNISNAIGNIQTWLSNLGTAISGFFTNLWTNLSTAFTNVIDWIKAPFLAPDGFLYLKFQALQQWFSDLGDRISGFFVTLVTNIKNLFVPSEEWKTTYKNNWSIWLHQHFAPLFDIFDFIGDLVDVLADFFNFNGDITVLTFDIPTLTILVKNDNGSGWARKTLFTAESKNLYNWFTLNGTLASETFDTMYSIYSILVTCLLIALFINRVKTIASTIFDIKSDLVDDEGGD